MCLMLTVKGNYLVTFLHVYFTAKSALFFITFTFIYLADTCIQTFLFFIIKWSLQIAFPIHNYL